MRCRWATLICIWYYFRLCGWQVTSRSRCRKSFYSSDVLHFSLICAYCAALFDLRVCILQILVLALALVYIGTFVPAARVILIVKHFRRLDLFFASRFVVIYSIFSFCFATT